MSYQTFNGTPIIPMPATPGFRQITFSMMDTVGVNTSPFTGQQQVMLWPGADYWSAEVSLPPMTRAQAAAWIAFLQACRGRANMFQLGDPLGRASKGIPSGSPVINGSHLATATTIHTRGWSPFLKNIVPSPDGPAGWSSNNPRLFSAPGAGTNGGSGWVYYGDSATSGDIFATSPAINVTPGATYTMSGYVDTTNQMNVGAPDDKPGWLVYNASISTKIANAYASIGFKGRVHTTFTVPAGVTQIKLLAGTRTATIKAGLLLILADPQVEAGSVAGPYTDPALLQPGDFIQIGWRMHQVVGTPIYADGSGNADVEIWPSLRESLTDGTAISISNAKGLFRLADNARSWSATELKTYGLQFKAVEAR